MSTSSAVKIYNKEGYIYKIVNTDENLIYIGSTFEGLPKRFYQHKKNFNNYKLGKYKGKNSCFEIFERYSPENTKIVLLETLDFPCKRYDLLKLEQKWIKDTVCVNKNAAIRTKEDQKTYEQGYYKENKPRIQKLSKEYRSNPEIKEKIKQRDKEYNKTEKAKILHRERQMKYMEKQRQQNLEERRKIEEKQKKHEEKRPDNFKTMTAKQKSDLRRKRARSREKFSQLACMLYNYKNSERSLGFEGKRNIRVKSNKQILEEKIK